MKKKLIALILSASMIFSICGCSEAERVSYNLSQEADNFNNVRQLTVINCLQGDILFQMTGKMSITADRADNQLEVIVELEDGTYKKHFIGLSDNVTYVVEDITGKDVSKYKYTLNFNPEMWWPWEADVID
ncbi:MAG: hypothetical protein HFH84_19575 [Lachnospiraceae bacterium]|jgi:hypothetical protein|nr:hypothetical protein [Lachnospiraceae bacterium]